MMPYVPETEMSKMGRELPQTMQESGYEIRTFMPKWGNINERRGQLHEVIRLSGMNLIIDETDHPLLIKVASIPQVRIQVYFIDNEDYFTKRQMTVDESGDEYPDNGERAIFFARGVLETVKKITLGTRYYPLSRLDGSSGSFLCEDCFQGRAFVCECKSHHGFISKPA